METVGKRPKREHATWDFYHAYVAVTSNCTETHFDDARHLMLPQQNKKGEDWVQNFPCLVT